MIVFDERGTPGKVLVRDLADAKIFGPSLRAPGKRIDVPAGLSAVSESREAARDQLIDTAFHLHLGEVVALFATHAGCDEGRLWAIVKESIRARLHESRHDFDGCIRNEEAAFPRHR
jgi:siderophore synthetase component